MARRERPRGLWPVASVPGIPSLLPKSWPNTEVPAELTSARPPGHSEPGGPGGHPESKTPAPRMLVMRSPPGNAHYRQTKEGQGASVDPRPARVLLGPPLPRPGQFSPRPPLPNLWEIYKPQTPTGNSPT
ncbi:hypothetical protein H1C71_032797 [Ictidomys tridecemlineatus]|nr:hypothetical protein H1C71_032797 [Ictidomys tridecemlineatus]